MTTAQKIQAASLLLASAFASAQDELANSLFWDEQCRDFESPKSKSLEALCGRINAAAIAAHDAWMDSK